MPDTLWTIVLAGGEGRRLAGITAGVPKQFWRPPGAPSLLRQTIDRFAPLAPRRRTVVIVNSAHRAHVAASDLHDAIPELVQQPMDRGTATGVLRALLPVLVRDADAIVVITPSDHGVVDESAFRAGIQRAAREARTRDAVVLFGAEPDRAHTDYGWISLGRRAAQGALRLVTSFVEKPSAETATRLFASGAVCNTMVIVARARTLWRLYSERLPSLARTFVGALRLDPAEHETFLAGAYARLTSHDFSRELLTGAEGLSAVVWPAKVGWSDLGTPDRLREWHRRRVCHPPAARRVSPAAEYQRLDLTAALRELADAEHVAVNRLARGAAPAVLSCHFGCSLSA